MVITIRAPATKCLPSFAHARAARQSPFTAACGLLEGVLRYMGQHNLLQSDMRLASFDDHYLYDSLTIPVDTVRQDNRQLARHCFDLIGKLIEGETPEPIQRKLDATLQRRYKAVE